MNRIAMMTALAAGLLAGCLCEKTECDDAGPALTTIQQPNRAQGLVSFGQGAKYAITITGVIPGGKKKGNALRLDLLNDDGSVLATMDATIYVTSWTKTTLTLGRGLDNDSEKPDGDWWNKQARFTLVRNGHEYPLTFTFVNRDRIQCAATASEAKREAACAAKKAECDRELMEQNDAKDPVFKCEVVVSPCALGTPKGPQLLPDGKVYCVFSNGTCTNYVDLEARIFFERNRPYGALHIDSIQAANNCIPMTNLFTRLDVMVENVVSNTCTIRIDGLKIEDGVCGERRYAVACSDSFEGLPNLPPSNWSNTTRCSCKTDQTKPKQFFRVYIGIMCMEIQGRGACELNGA